MRSGNVTQFALPRINSIGVDGVGRYAEILESCQRLSDFLGEHEGIPAKACAPRPLLEAYLALPEAQQKQIHHAALTSYATCEDVVASGRSLKEHRFSVERHLARHRVRVDQDVLETIDKHACVEIYDFHFLQTFRTPNFFNYVEHSLEEFAILPYWEIFDREQEISEKIVHNATKILTGTHVGPMWNFIEDNIVREKGTRRATRLHTAVCAPIYGENSGEILGLIHVFDIAFHSNLMLLS